MRDTRFADNGADGLELDERAAGDADFSLRGTSLIGNGSFTSEDFDDGIDVDEGGEGDLVGRFDDVVARGTSSRASISTRTAAIFARDGGRPGGGQHRGGHRVRGG